MRAAPAVINAIGAPPVIDAIGATRNNTLFRALRSLRPSEALPNIVISTEVHEVDEVEKSRLITAYMRTNLL